MSKMMDAFIEQTYAPHGGIDAFEEKRQEVFDKASQIHDEWISESKSNLNRSQNCSDYINIPTKLKNGELNQKTEAHPSFANYDHSLESNRLTVLRDKYDYIEPEPTYIDSSDMQINTEAYENVDPAEVPNLSGLFDNVFGLD